MLFQLHRGDAAFAYAPVFRQEWDAMKVPGGRKDIGWTVTPFTTTVTGDSDGPVIYFTIAELIRVAALSGEPPNKNGPMRGSPVSGSNSASPASMIASAVCAVKGE